MNTTSTNKYLIIYSSTDGQTKKISEKIASSLTKKAQQVTRISIEEVSTIDLKSFNNIIIGASIRYGKHSKEINDFIEENYTLLNKNNCSFFSVNLVARKENKNTKETNPYVKKFLTKIKWIPKKVAVFGGRLDYPSYKFLDRVIIQFIMWLTNGPTDKKSQIEFTNWKDVEKFATELI